MSTQTLESKRRDARHRRPRGEPQPFDFRRPTTLSREHVRAMQIVQETLARGFTTTLASKLRAVCSVTIRDIEQRPYDEYVRELPNPALLTLLSLRPLVGTAMLQLPLRIAYAATELMLGGVGGANQPRRQMTDLETSLMRSILELTMPEIRYAFEPIVAVEPAIVGQESNPQFAQLVAPTDMVIIASFDVRIEAVTEVMTLCIPFSSLQPHLEALSATDRSNGETEEKIAEGRARVHQHISDSDVSASARFRSTVATSSQVADLGVGDVLLFNHPVGLPLTLQTGGTAIFDVTIGRVNRHLALQITGEVPSDRPKRRSRLQITKSSEHDESHT
jgi:flagellar motor switch protein FliM